MGKIRLTSRGVVLLEKSIIEAFIKNPEEVRRASEVLGLDLDYALKKYLERYFAVEEDLELIRSGVDPQHHPLEYYTSE